MKHGFGYTGWFENSFPNFRSGGHTFYRKDGRPAKTQKRPDDLDGIFFRYMTIPNEGGAEQRPRGGR